MVQKQEKTRYINPIKKPLMKIKRVTYKWLLRTVLLDWLKRANLEKCSVAIPHVVDTILPFQNIFLFLTFRLILDIFFQVHAFEGREFHYL